MPLEFVSIREVWDVVKVGLTVGVESVEEKPAGDEVQLKVGVPPPVAVGLPPSCKESPVHIVVLFPASIV